MTRTTAYICLALGLLLTGCGDAVEARREMEAECARLKGNLREAYAQLTACKAALEAATTAQASEQRANQQILEPAKLQHERLLSLEQSPDPATISMVQARTQRLLTSQTWSALLRGQTVDSMRAMLGGPDTTLSGEQCLVYRDQFWDPVAATLVPLCVKHDRLGRIVAYRPDVSGMPWLWLPVQPVEVPRDPTPAERHSAPGTSPALAAARPEQGRTVPTPVEWGKRLHNCSMPEVRRMLGEPDRVFGSRYDQWMYYDATTIENRSAHLLISFRGGLVESINTTFSKDR